jgi:anti-anti-sigma factor
MSELAEIHVRGEDRAPIIVIVGEIDISNVAIIREAIDASVPDAVVLVIDLSRTTFLDSAGIALLLAIGDRLHTTRRELYVVIPEDAPIRRVTKLAGLDAQVPVVASVDDVNPGAI